MIDWTHVLVAGSTATSMVLGRVVYEFARRRRDFGSDGNGGRITMHDLREAIHEVRNISQANALKLGVLERDVEWIKKGLVRG